MTLVDADTMKYGRRKNSFLRPPIIIMASIGIGIFLLAWFHDPSGTGSLRTENQLILSDFANAHDLSTGSIPKTSFKGKDIAISPQKVEMDDVVAYMQKPPGKKIDGIVTLFHGCNHDGIDWFILPEGRNIVKFLLSQNHAVVAFSSHHRTGTRCWATEFPSHHNHDARKIKKIWEKFLHKKFGKKASKSLPVYGIGSSNGGEFMTVLNHKTIDFKGMALIVSTGSLEGIKWLAEKPEKDDIRVAFVYMPNDKRFATASKVRRRMNTLEFHPTAKFECDPKPVTAASLVANVDGLTMGDATGVIDALSSEPLSILDADTKMFTDNPRLSWEEIESKALSKLNSVQILSLQEIFNVAHGVHETTSEHIEDVYQFWKSKDVKAAAIRGEEQDEKQDEKQED